MKRMVCALLVLCVALGTCSGEEAGNGASDSDVVDSVPDSETSLEEKVEWDENTIEGKMLSLVYQFNQKSETKLTYVEDFTPSDKTSSHYRVEFRLSAYKDAIGKSYTFDGAVVDIIGRKEWLSGKRVRVYMDDATFDQCVTMIQILSPIMDAEIDPSEVQETVDYVVKHKEANGRYYGDLCVLLLGNDVKGYSFMLKQQWD